MPSDLVVTAREGYLEARLSGDFRLEHFKRRIETIVQTAKDRGADKVLVDVTRMVRFESVNTTDRFEMGAHAARLAGNLAAIAMVGRPPQIDPEKFGAQVAQNRGLNIRIFVDETAAVAWLAAAEPKD
jgi:hypothetical protein